VRIGRPRGSGSGTGGTGSGSGRHAGGFVQGRARASWFRSAVCRRAASRGWFSSCMGWGGVNRTEPGLCPAAWATSVRLPSRRPALPCRRPALPCRRLALPCRRPAMPCRRPALLRRRLALPCRRLALPCKRLGLPSRRPVSPALHSPRCTVHSPRCTCTPHGAPGVAEGVPPPDPVPVRMAQPIGTKLQFVLWLMPVAGRDRLAWRVR
jgi:hypothetical protein